MTTNFPAGPDNFPRPTEFDNTDTAGKELDILADHHSDAIEAVQEFVLDPANRVAAAGLLKRVGGSLLGYYAPGWFLGATWSTHVVPYQHVDYTQFYLSETETLQSLGFVTTVANAGQVVEVALYEADEFWQPSNRLYTSGEIDVSAAAQYDLGYPLGLSLPPGRYLAGMQVKHNTGVAASGSVTCRAPGNDASSFVRELVSTGAGSIGGGVWRLLRKNLVWLPFSDPADANHKWTVVPGVYSGPFIFMRLS